jgi:hypothetical protein
MYNVLSVLFSISIRTFIAIVAVGSMIAPAKADEPGSSAIEAFLADWDALVDRARASQPSWSSPLITTTSTLEQRARFDTSLQHAGTGANTTVLDGGKGIDLIVADTTEIQIALAPYDIRTTPKNKSNFSGFGDWPFFRIKERLFSSPADQDDYVVSAWVQTQASTGIAALSSDAFSILPTVGFGKGFDRLVFQGTIGAVIPTNYETKLGNQIAGNLAVQYHLDDILWPQWEVNWTHWVDGQRDDKDQVFMTPGLVVGRIPLAERLKLTAGLGYQFAVSPHYQPSPLLPSYNHAWVFTTRLNF